MRSKIFARARNGAGGDARRARPGKDATDDVVALNRGAGLARSIDGGLLPTAGLISSMDNVVKTITKWGGKDASNNVKIISEAAEKVSDNDTKNAQVYVKIFKKIESSGENYLTTEIARLSKMLDGGSISAKQKSMFQYKVNILNLS